MNRITEDADAEPAGSFLAVVRPEADERGGGAIRHVPSEFQSVALGAPENAAGGGEKSGHGMDDLQRQLTKVTC